MAGITIKDAPLVKELSLNDKIPISDGSGAPKAASFEQVKQLCGGGDVTQEMLDGKQDTILDLSDIRQGAKLGSTAVQPENLANVAKSGNYNDLTNKPTIPAEQVNADWDATSGKAKILNKPTIPPAITENTVSGWGFTKNAGTYNKPSSGIPKSDLNPAVQNSIDKADSAIQEHQDISHLASIDTLNKGLEEKVDKEEGKQLTTEDFTTLLKQKLEALNNYDDTAVNDAISRLRSDFDILVGGDSSSAIESFNEIVAFLDGITDNQDLDSIIASIEQQIAGKMDNVTLAAVATSGSYNDLKDKPTIPDVATVDSVLSTTSTNAVQNKVVTAELNKKGTYSKPSSGIPKTDLANTVQTSLGKADTALQSVPDIYATKTNLAEALAPIGTLYKGAWTATKTEGISQLYTERITVPAGTYIISTVLPYAKVGHGNQICIGFTAKMAIGVGNTFLDASYGCTTQMATFTTTTSIAVMSAASANSAEWDYLDRGGIAALKIK